MDNKICCMVNHNGQPCPGCHSQSTSNSYISFCGRCLCTPCMCALSRTTIADNQRKPYICPNCGGYGNREKVQPGTYSSTRTSCWSCSGTGIVWG